MKLVPLILYSVVATVSARPHNNEKTQSPSPGHVAPPPGPSTLPNVPPPPIAPPKAEPPNLPHPPAAPTLPKVGPPNYPPPPDAPTPPKIGPLNLPPPPLVGHPLPPLVGHPLPPLVEQRPFTIGALSQADPDPHHTLKAAPSIDTAPLPFQGLGSV